MVKRFRVYRRRLRCGGLTPQAIAGPVYCWAVNGPFFSGPVDGPISALQSSHTNAVAETKICYRYAYLFVWEIALIYTVKNYDGKKLLYLFLQKDIMLYRL